MSYSQLNFNTGTLVKPFEGLQESVGAGSIFAKILTANDEQKQQDKILAERAAERAEAKAEREQDRADRQARYDLEDMRYNKQEMLKQVTDESIGDIAKGESGDFLLPEQSAQIVAARTKDPEGMTAANMQAQFIEQNKKDAGARLKYLNAPSNVSGTLFNPISGTLNEQDEFVSVAPSQAVLTEQKDKLTKPLKEAYAMSLYSNNPKASREQLMKQYESKTGMNMDAGIQEKIDNNIFKREDVELKKEQNRIANEQVAETRRNTKAINDQKKREELEYIRGLQIALADVDPASVYEMKGGKPVMEENPYPTGPNDKMIPKLKIGATVVKYLEDKYKEVTSKQTKINDYYNDVLKDIPGHLAKIAGKKVDYISEGTLLDAQQLLSKYDTPKAKVEALKKIEPYIEDRWGGLEYFGSSQIPNKIRKELGLE